MQRKQVVILGGGLTGLSAGLKLSKDCEVTILEKSSQVGGLASSFEINGKKIPKYYHHVFAHDYVTHSYLQKAGVFSKMRWQRIKMAICSAGKVYNFTNVSGLLKLDLLSFWGRIRYGLFGAYVFTLMNPKKIPDSMDVREWLLRHAGEEVTDKLFQELYGRNKFNIPLTQISAKQFAHRLKAKEAMGKFGYPAEGLDRMIEYLETNIRGNGGRIITSANLSSIDLEAKKITVDGNEISADIIISTIPVPEFLKIAEGLPENYAERISKVRYCPVVGVVIGTRDFLGEHYWYNILHERVHIIIQHSRLCDGYGEKVSWVSRYGGSEEDIGLSDEEIKEAYLAVVQKYFPGTEVVWAKVFREMYAEPIYDKYYPSYKPDYTTPVEGLYMAGIAVTYPEIRNMNTALKSGLKVAQEIRKAGNEK